MMRRRLIWLIYPSYIAITIFSLALVGVFAARELRQAYVGQAEADLQVRSRLLFETALPLLSSPPELDRLCKKMGAETDTRFTIIAPDGRVLVDSEADPTTMENHADRPEVAAALASGKGLDLRHSRTTGRDMLYVALALPSGKPVLVARAAQPLASISEVLRVNYEKIALAAVVAAALAALMSWLVARRLSAALFNLRQGAARFASGDLSFRVRAAESEEFSALAESMNRMAEELEDRIQTVTAQRNELEVMLAAMVEAVVVVDREERVARLNLAAGRLLGVNPDEARGRPLPEVARNLPLLQFVSRLLAGAGPAEDEIKMFIEGATAVLRAHGNLIRGPRGMVTHALVVFHDVTRLQQLEVVRRDFVANVSHELKTPLTSIRAAAETLKSGAEPADAERFMDIILRHSERLNAIIDDLLALSRIEQGEEKGEIALEPGRVCEVLAAAVAALDRAAREKNIRVELDCAPELWALMNAALLEQAVTNLLDNAIKYSGPGTTVRVRAGIETDRVTIAVEDQGPGIPAEHQGRIFERFYRVDKARSRKLGGTGLGLSIARHIAGAHGGEIRVSSEVGKGSIFTIRLPA
jgi:two-component system phosphate regulon sensor histidine kinase PhoR